MHHPPTPPTPKFTDQLGRDWPVRLSFASVRAIRAATEIDFGEPEKFPQYWAQLLADEELAIKVLETALAESLAARDVTAEAWLEAVDGETLENGMNALAEAVVLFTRPQKRGLITDSLAKINEYWEKAVADSRAAIEKFNETHMNQALERLGN